MYSNQQPTYNDSPFRGQFRSKFQRGGRCNTYRGRGRQIKRYEEPSQQEEAIRSERNKVQEKIIEKEVAPPEPKYLLL